MRSPSVAERTSIVRVLFGESAAAKLESYAAFFEVYEAVACPEHTIIQIEPHEFATHDEILELIQHLRTSTRLTRREFKDRVFRESPTGDFTETDHEHSINVAIQLLLMVDCADKARHWEGYEVNGYKPVTWRDSERLTDFMERIFPTNPAHREASRAALQEKNMLKGWKLQKRSRVKFVPTNNLVQHLLYDPQDNSVRVFHHTAFLKAKLRLSADLPLDADMADCLQLGTLPPQLILETLHSLHHIIFPSVDSKSSHLLQNLVLNKSFDRDLLLDEVPTRKPPEHFHYHYWGERLAKLHYLAKNPRPTNAIAQWVQRHASERNILLVGILALVVSAVSGILTLVVSCFQAWVAWRAWRDQAGGGTATR